MEEEKNISAIPKYKLSSRPNLFGDDFATSSSSSISNRPINPIVKSRNSVIGNLATTTTAMGKFGGNA